VATTVETKAAVTGITRRPPDRFRTLTSVVATAGPAALVLITLILLQGALPAVRQFGLGFLVGQSWNPVTNAFGALPAIFGTVSTSFLALALALPVGVAVAVVLAEPGHTSIRGVIGTGIELLAAIPSVVYGIWALYVLAPWSYQHLEIPISSRVEFIGLKENAVALGATWWETTWRVILPAARPGIFGATILALGRALGETIAVTMVIGNRYEIPQSIFQPAYTLASVIANEFNEATGTLHPAALIELGLVLILVTLTVNVFALLLVRSVSRETRITA
jgi:phosphate transport system permease protein